MSEPHDRVPGQDRWLARGLSPRQLVIGALAVFLLAVQIVGWDRPATVEYADATFKRALVAFGVARGINAAISVLQESEVRVGVGVGASVKPGQALDPVNDLVERFSWVMLVTSIAAFAVKLTSQLMLGAEVVGALGAVMVVGVLLAGAGAGLAARAGSVMFRFASVLALAFLTVTVLPLASNAFHDLDLVERSYEESHRALSTATRQVEDLAGGTPPSKAAAPPDAAGDDGAAAAESSLWQDAREFFGESLPRYVEERSARVSEAAGYYLGKLDVRPRLDAAREMAAELPEQVVVQIALFTLEVFLVPLLVLWLGYRVALWQWHSESGRASPA